MTQYTKPIVSIKAVQARAAATAPMVVPSEKKSYSKMSEQTVQTQIKLRLKEQFDQGLHCATRSQNLDCTLGSHLDLVKFNVKYDT